MQGLFGDEFDIIVKEKPVKDLVKKAAPQKAEDTAEKQLKSKKLTLWERVSIIIERVSKVLGKQKQNVLVIRDKATFISYIDNAIKAGRIAVDTETNNSTDPVTCKIMGLCLYYPGGKQAYIPINHVDLDTKLLLENQLTEADCKEQLQRVVDAGTFIVMHNGKFDYEVIKATCGIEIVPNWDTIIGARLLDENEFSGKRSSLKYIYTKYIDPSQEKYDIEGLFENVPYAVVPPDTFALYAATDSLMTDKVYELQKPQFEQPGNERLYWVFKNIEMPIVKITGDMELEGVSVDQNFGERLRIKYNNTLTELDTEINKSLELAKILIDAWRKTPYAMTASKQWEPKKTKKSLAEIKEAYPNIDPKSGKRYKTGKAPRDQLGDPINLASPTQLAILFYDILGAKNGKPGNRSTGEEELEAVKTNLELEYVELKERLAKAEEEYEYSNKDLQIKIAYELVGQILDRRGIVKLITTYIDVIPELSKHWPDHRIRFKLNSLGTDTGRYSSGGKIKFMEGEEPLEVSGINIQNIPSHNKEIRMLFEAHTDTNEIEVINNVLDIPGDTAEIDTIDGWKFLHQLAMGDTIITDEGNRKIKSLVYMFEVDTWRIFLEA